MFLKTFVFKKNKKPSFVGYLLFSDDVSNNYIFLGGLKKIKKAGKIVFRKERIINYANLIDFFDNFLKCNFFFFIKVNFFSKKAFLLFKDLFWLSVYNNLTKSFSMYFVFIFSMFLYYKNPNILFNFIQTFFRLFNFKKQKSLHYIMYYFSKKIKKNFLNNNNIYGFVIKFRGKYMRRPGERRKTYIYKFFSYSITNTCSRYIVSYRQLWNKSGATGLTINMLYS